MVESIFSSLFKYRATDKQCPEENYLTEMLCWMINNVPGFAGEYMKLLSKKAFDQNDSSIKDDFSGVYEISAETQVYVENGYIDMVIHTYAGFDLICEHKVDTDLAYGQLDKYREAYNTTARKVVLVTKKKITEDELNRTNNKKPDIALQWKDIYDHFAQIKKKFIADRADILIEQFLTYLTECGMGEQEALKVESIEYYSGFEKLPDILNTMFNDINDDPELIKNFDVLKEMLNITEFTPTVNKRWGRVGIDFTKKWSPLGLFAGVVYNNNDHKLRNFKKPQFVIIIDIDIKAEDVIVDPSECKNAILLNPVKMSIRDYYNGKEWVRLLQTIQLHRIENMEHIYQSRLVNFDNQPANKWRLVILRKALDEVLKSNNYEEQRDNIKEAIISGLSIVADIYSKFK